METEEEVVSETFGVEAAMCVRVQRDALARDLLPDECEDERVFVGRCL